MQLSLATWQQLSPKISRSGSGAKIITKLSVDGGKIESNVKHKLHLRRSFWSWRGGFSWLFQGIIWRFWSQGVMHSAGSIGWGTNRLAASPQYLTISISSGTPVVTMFVSGLIYGWLWSGDGTRMPAGSHWKHGQAARTLPAKHSPPLLSICKPSCLKCPAFTLKLINGQL